MLKCYLPTARYLLPEFTKADFYKVSHYTLDLSYFIESYLIQTQIIDIIFIVFESFSLLNSLVISVIHVMMMTFLMSDRDKMVML